MCSMISLGLTLSTAALELLSMFYFESGMSGSNWYNKYLVISCLM